MSSWTERGHRGQSQPFGMCVCVCMCGKVESEVFKAGHAAVINITEDINALLIPEHTTQHEILLDTPLSWLQSVCEGEKKRDRQLERESGRRICS